MASSDDSTMEASEPRGFQPLPLQSHSQSRARSGDVAEDEDAACRQPPAAVSDGRGAVVDRALDAVFADQERCGWPGRRRVPSLQRCDGRAWRRAARVCSLRMRKTLSRGCPAAARSVQPVSDSATAFR